MLAILRYDAACRAVAAARSVDEAKDLADKAEAVRIYARQAKNKQLEVDAAEIRLRAERRLGEILAARKAEGALQPGQLLRGSARVLRDGPTLAELGIGKKLSSRCQQIAAVPVERFEGDIGAWRDRVSRENERITMSLIVREPDKAERRDARERELGLQQLAMPKRRYGVILADPEWRFEPWSRVTGMDRAPENHYSTSLTTVIASRPVATIAAADCVLFLWGTAPMLPAALEVIAAWGFAYVTHAVWVKDRIITGYWFRFKHEILLVGTRGNVVAPAPGRQWGSVIEAPRGRHSKKPDQVYELIEAYFPTLPRIELNARTARPGWDRWGAEAPAAGGEAEIEESSSAAVSPGSGGTPPGARPPSAGAGAPAAAGDDDLAIPNFLSVGRADNNWRKETQR